MTLKLVWGVTGSGDKLPETVAAMAAVIQLRDFMAGVYAFTGLLS